MLKCYNVHVSNIKSGIKEELKTLRDQMKTDQEKNDITNIYSTGNIQIIQNNGIGAQHTHRQAYPIKKNIPKFKR